MKRHGASESAHLLRYYLQLDLPTTCALIVYVHVKLGPRREVMTFIQNNNQPLRMLKPVRSFPTVLKL